MKRISVITVTYNSATTLGYCLRSTARQTHPDIEHIVIDGGSHDATHEVISREGTHIAYYVSERDAGIYDAMNKGIAAASGEIIGFLNADDFYSDNEVLTRVQQIFFNNSMDIVFGDVAFFNAANPSKIIRRYRSNRFKPDLIGWGLMPAHPAMFVRRAVFEKAGPFQINYQIAGDFEWVARAFKNKKLRFQYLPEVLVHMQTGGISTKGWRSTVLLNQEVMRACRENGIATNWFKILSKYPFKLWEYVRP